MLLACTREPPPPPNYCYKTLLFPSARSAISKPILYPPSIYFIHRTVMPYMYTMHLHRYILYIYINTYKGLYTTGNIAIFIAPGNCFYLRHPPTLPNRYRLLSTIFTLRIRIYARCSVKLFSLSFFFLFHFFHRNLSHCVGTGTAAIGRRRPRLHAVPSHGRLGCAGPRGSTTRVRPSSPLVDVE